MFMRIYEMWNIMGGGDEVSERVLQFTLIIVAGAFVRQCRRGAIEGRWRHRNMPEEISLENQSNCTMRMPTICY